MSSSAVTRDRTPAPSASKLFACVPQTLPHIFILALELLRSTESSHARQRLLDRLVLHQGKHLRESPAGYVLQRCPVFGRKAVDFQGIARHHLQIEMDLGPGPT